GAALGLGAALGATSAVAYAGNVFVVRRLAARIGASRAIAYHSLLAAIVVAPLGAGHLDAIDAGDLAYLGAGSLLLGALAGIGFVAGLSRIGSARAAVLTFLEPLVAVIVGWTAFGEGLGPIAALGGALILGAGLWVVRAPARATAAPG
ncbi:MAG: DMT family transporter, partial [Myxococcales bacterium]|nr:DMT family transporter [Myxococcales bacterium]